MKFIDSCERYFTPIGRIILGAFFLLAGIDKVMTFSGKVAWLDSIGFPMASVLIAGAVVLEIGAGLMMLLGYKTKYAALALALFTLVVTFLFHGPNVWSAEDPTQQLMFMKNIAIFGGLLFMAAHIGAPCCNPKHNHEEETETPKPTL